MAVVAVAEEMQVSTPSVRYVVILHKELSR